MATLLAWRTGAPRALAFFASMLLHCVTDLPLHHDDAHAHFLPFSSWRFESPVSYWDPHHYGRFFSAVEAAFVLGGAGALAFGSPVKAWRAIGALTLLAYAVLVAFALTVWL